jgi:hypothetical protein
MEKKLTAELKTLKEDFDFIHKKIGELEWERATIYYGRKAVSLSEFDKIDTQLENYRENISILVEKIKNAVRDANVAERENK